jgi:hypothetical protein
LPLIHFIATSADCTAWQVSNAPYSRMTLYLELWGLSTKAL